MFSNASRYTVFLIQKTHLACNFAQKTLKGVKTAQRPEDLLPFSTLSVHNYIFYNFERNYPNDQNVTNLNVKICKNIGILLSIKKLTVSQGCLFRDLTAVLRI